MRPWYRFCRYLCHVVFMAVFRGRVLNTRRVPRSGGGLLVCNHQSYLDPVLSALALPREVHFMARGTLFRGGATQWLIESLNAFPVERGTADIGAIKTSLRVLKSGGLLTVFPEATRTRDGRIGTIHGGVILMARKARVPIVPTLILGAFEAWPRFAKLPRPRPILVVYGEAIPPEELARHEDEACVAMVRGRLLALMRRYRSHPLVAEHLRPLPAGEVDATATPATDRPPEVRVAGYPAASGQ